MSNKIHCYFFPHAGGNRHSYLTLKSTFTDEINFVPFELPGRGTRIDEALISDIGLLVDNIYESLNNNFDIPYALAGHSLGSLIVYLLALKIHENKRPLPIHLFVSGRGGPSVNYSADQSKYRSTQTREELFNHLFELGGIPEEIVQNDDFLTFLEPIVRADLRLLEMYEYKKSVKLSVPITVLLGKNDETNHEEASLWADETENTCSIEYFEGGHFYILDRPKEVCEVISKKLLSTKIHSHVS